VPSSDGLPFSSASTIVAGIAGHRLAEISDRYFRSRMFLAPAHGLRENDDTKDENDLLESQIRGQRQTRPFGSAPPHRFRLGGGDDLGMPNTRSCQAIGNPKTDSKTKSPP
jgi:hypothetical protein